MSSSLFETAVLARRHGPPLPCVRSGRCIQSRQFRMRGLL